MAERGAAAPAVPPLRGLVLAGGRSERLGRDKAAVEVDGTTLLERAVAALAAVTGDVRVAVRADQLADRLRGRFRLIEDAGQGIGPAAGILAAHAADPGSAWLVLACDMPLAGPAELRALVAARDPARAATAFRAAADGLPEPLCALYEPATLAAFRRHVAAGGNPSPRGWLAAAHPLLLDAPAPDALDSINTPEDLEHLARAVRRPGGAGGHRGPTEDATRTMARKTVPRRPTRAQAEEAVRTLIRWAGDDAGRPGVRKTPARVLGSFDDWFAGYAVDPYELLGSSFQQVNHYDRVVTLRDIDFESHCEHHMAPILGRIHLAYLPNRRLAGISKLVRVVEAYTKRLQVQERMTAEIARCINDVLEPRGVAVMVEAQHQCMTTRGVHRRDVMMVTTEMLGAFQDDDRIRAEFLAAVRS